jgi:acyl-CoA synthetase (AMP-forming)/AMP-acid ligase II
LTYAQLGELADGLTARLLQDGVQPGDRVALVLSNSIEYVVAYLAAFQAGAIVVGLNPEATANELAGTLADCEPVAAVFEPKAGARLAQAVDSSDSIRLTYLTGEAAIEGGRSSVSFDEACRKPAASSGRRQPNLDEIAQIIYTSGTTGRPKGVTLSQRNLAANCRSILSYLQLTPADSVLVTLPFFYSYGNSLLFTHLASGGRLVLANDTVFWNKALDLMQTERCSGFSGVPSTFAMLLHKSDFEKRQFSDLRYLTCAGGALAATHAKRLQSVVPDAQLFLMYGQTEATARLSTLLPEDVEHRLGSIGKGIDGVELQVLDEQASRVAIGEVGEIVARGDNIMTGYWNDREESQRVLRPEGLRTGDLARIDEDGYIWIVGRSSDFIKYGAYRINPAEIEDVLLAVDGIAEAAVAGAPDELWGEIPVGYVVASDAATPPSERELLDLCRRQLPRYKQLREVHFVESLPRTASGKIKRGELCDARRASMDRKQV